MDPEGLLRRAGEGKPSPYSMNDSTHISAPTVDHVAHWFEQKQATNPRIIEDPSEPGAYLLRFDMKLEDNSWATVDSWPLPATNEQQAKTLLETLEIF